MSLQFNLRKALSLAHLIREVRPDDVIVFSPGYVTSDRRINYFPTRGTVLRVNRKTFAVMTEEGDRVRVPKRNLKKVLRPTVISDPSPDFIHSQLTETL